MMEDEFKGMFQWKLQASVLINHEPNVIIPSS